MYRKNKMHFSRNFRFPLENDTIVRTSRLIATSRNDLLIDLAYERDFGAILALARSYDRLPKLQKGNVG
jgi:hypothetical protein